MEYNFREIEKKWQHRWVEQQTYRVKENKDRRKFYVLNMFPYPSGAGLHVGHPLGYIASDIYARYKRLQGFNVLNPMGYDAYGLPAEQYAIQTGQHPAITTEANIRRYREQLDKIGFSFDWSREIRTCDPEYYHWTQWAFQKMFNSYYRNDKQQARPIEELIACFEKNGTEGLDVACSEELSFTAEEWGSMTEKQRQEVLMNYRIAYLGETMVNWCPQLGTVLANDEVVDGVSERGGYPVVQKKMRQWCLRVSAYAQRLLDGLDTIDWTDSLKETQKNWIGRSEGAEVKFRISRKTEDGEQKCDSDLEEFTIFTTRADTMFGVTFMVLAPESELVEKLTTAEQKAEVNAYIERTKKRTERERIADRSVTGVFSGSYAVNPLTGKDVPIWISDYVLAGYGTGAIMAVPAHDSRDYAFAKHFNLPIIPLIEGADVSEESYDAKEGIVCNSPCDGEKPYCDLVLNGLTVKEAIAATKKYVSEHNLGRVKVNYRLRDAIFSRQRYWGEPFPVYYKDGMPYMIPEECLPLELPEVDKFLPTETGEPPLGNATRWAWDTEKNCVVENSLIDNVRIFPLELNTMPGFAGSSAYYLRYMDPRNHEALVSKDADGYWQNVDLYVGGTEHATGHLIYSRFWNKFLYDYGYSCKEEPFQKLVNQGMIQGRSNFVCRFTPFKLDTKEPISTNIFISKDIAEQMLKGEIEPSKLKDIFDNNNIKYEKSWLITQGLNLQYVDLHVDVNLVTNDILDENAFRNWRPEYKNVQFVHNKNGKYVCSWAVEKMSKSMYNVVNPDIIVEKYGADTLRLYEMFLGPVEQSKPWDTNGIDGCHRFLKKFWGLFDKVLSGSENLRQSAECRVQRCDMQKNASTNGNHTSELKTQASELNIQASELNIRASELELKSVHKLIKKVTQDIEHFSYNTSISAFMICVNELTQLKCTNRELLKNLVVVIAPFAPHIAEELWERLGGEGSVCDARWPQYDEKYLVESSVQLGVAFNGKRRFEMQFAADADNKLIEETVLADEHAQKYIEGKQVVKVIIVPKRMVNVVIK